MEKQAAEAFAKCALAEAKKHSLPASSTSAERPSVTCRESWHMTQSGELHVEVGEQRIENEEQAYENVVAPKAIHDIHDIHESGLNSDALPSPFLP